MVALAGKPALEPPVEPDPPPDPESAARPQPVSARAATAVTPTTLAMRRICMFPFCARPGGTRVCGCGEEPRSALLAEGFVELLDLRGCRWRLHRVTVGSFGSTVAHEQAGDGRPALRLVVDVEGHGHEQHQALDHLGHIGAGTHQLETVVEHRHDEAADDRPDDGADPATDGGATDEHRSDRVELPADAVER